MKYRLPVLALFHLVCSATVLLGQTASAPTPTVAERSHVERFSTPRVRDERAESEATRKLAANPNDAEALRTRAYARMGLQRYPEALEDLRRSLTIEPNNVTVKANYGYVLWKLGRRAEAINEEREAVKLDEKNFTAQYQLGRFLMFSGGEQNLREAATHLRRALEIDPRQSEIRFDLLAAYRTLGDTAQAIAQLNLLQDSRPADPRVTYVDALLASDRGDLNAAVTGFRQALRLDPNLYGAKQDLGLALIKLKKWNESAEVFADLARQQSDSVEIAYFNALSLFNTGRSDDAEREARRALRLDAGAAAAHTLLGIILAARGGHDAEASEALTQAVALDQNSFDARFYLGRVQYAMQDYASAVKSLRGAIALDGRNPEARFFLGTALES
ncbi:MAG TPA: tetratricopeptide repeat protein, partial [Pyrinomonadaceae bacterium]|nr:tetratricopeptide repeat protein [Pyrinomonadaceae bacterium]